MNKQKKVLYNWLRSEYRGFVEEREKRKKNEQNEWWKGGRKKRSKQAGEMIDVSHTTSWSLLRKISYQHRHCEYIRSMTFLEMSKPGGPSTWQHWQLTVKIRNLQVKFDCWRLNLIKTLILERLIFSRGYCGEPYGSWISEAKVNFAAQSVHVSMWRSFSYVQCFDSNKEVVFS